MRWRLFVFRCHRPCESRSDSNGALRGGAGGESRGTTAARSENPKVLELTSDQPLEERYQALAPGVADILFSPPINIPGTCWSGYGYQHPNIAKPCVVAKVTVTQSCAGKSSGNCSSPQSKRATGSNETPPQVSPSLAALKAKQSPLAIMCKQRFFTKTQLQLLVQQFGFIECFRFTGQDQWVVIGSGARLNSNAPGPYPTRGGPVVAMEKCASSDWSCLDPSAVHNFANFTVYYSPGPTTDPLGNLHGTAYGNLLSMVGGPPCRGAIFDMTTGRWYPNTIGEKTLETIPASFKSLPAPAPVSGSKAFTQEASPATVSAC